MRQHSNRVIGQVDLVKSLAAGVVYCGLLQGVSCMCATDDGGREGGSGWGLGGIFKQPLTLKEEDLHTSCDITEAKDQE